MNKNPVFSIIVPFYNVENYIVECLKSIINQTYKNFEVLCVDDCSEDNTAKIVEIFAQEDERIKIIKHRKNKGLGAARNTAIKKARGNYIVCVDSDDYIIEDLLENVYDKFKKYNTEVVWFTTNMYYHHNQETKEHDAFKNLYSLKDGILKITENNIIDFPLVSWNKAYNKEFLLKNNIFWTEGKSFEDVEFYWKVHTKINQVYLINKPMYTYRRRVGSICCDNTNFVSNIKDLFDVTTLVYDYLVEENLLVKYKTQFLRYVFDVLANKRVNNNYTKVMNKNALEFLKNIHFPA